jgi:SAM-dependent methyltransferase
MTKIAEIMYLKNLGGDGQIHALNKPFSDLNCGNYLIDIGQIISLLPPPPGKLLDLGAGSCWTSVFFAKRGYDVTAQDISEDMLKLAEKNRSLYNVDKLRFILSDYEQLKLNEEFDYAVFFDSLHHAVDPQAAINSVFKALKPGGICLTVEPGKGHSKLEQTIRVVEKMGVTEKDMPPSLIMKLGRNAGFRKMKVYLRQNNKPIEILPFFSRGSFIGILKLALRLLPGIGTARTNITMMIK